MKPLPLLFLSAALLLPLCALTAQGADRVILAEDDAGTAAYRDGWKGGGGGSGFGDWKFQKLKAAEGESHAGFFIADAGNNPASNGVALHGKAFAIYANGVAFEAAAAFRPLHKALKAGQTFSFLLQHGTIARKVERDDPGTGAIGLTLRAGRAAEAVDNYNEGARFEIGTYEGKANYQIFAGEAATDSGVPLTEGGISISLTLVSADTYDLEITTLADKKTTTLKGRKLGGTAGTSLESFCIFNRDGEKSDAFFNGFQISGERE